MKTHLMMDAINYFNANITVSEYDHVYKRGGCYSTLIGCKYGLCDKRYELVCSVDEIYELMLDLSNWQPTLPKVETVEVGGMVYEIGKYYSFSDNNNVSEFLTKLVGYSDVKKAFHGTSGYWEFCRSVEPTVIGTITPAPTKLIDGEAYMFDYNESKSLIGILHTSIKFGIEHRMFCMPKDDAKYNSEFCTNITPLSSNK